MNNIQKYIDLLKLEKEKAMKDAEEMKANSVLRNVNEAYALAFSFAIGHAELLLLKTENEEDR